MRRSKIISDGPDYKIAMGKRSELIAADYLMMKGCYVYMPFIEQGPIDLIALDKEGVEHRFDVKTVSRRKDGTIISRSLSNLQQKLGVQLLYVCLDSYEVHKYPHHFSLDTVPLHSRRNAANRRFNGETPPTIDELLPQESSPTVQSCSEESSQCADQQSPSKSNQRKEPYSSDQSGGIDLQTVPEFLG